MDILECIPHRPPFLFIDKVLSCDGDFLVAERSFRPDEYFYQGHYPGNPITPGVILCEAVFQAGALLLVHRSARDGTALGHLTPILSRVQDARFKRMVKPGDTVTIDVRYKEAMSKFHFITGRMSCEGKTVLTLECALAMIEEA